MQNDYKLIRREFLNCEHEKYLKILEELMLSKEIAKKQQKQLLDFAVLTKEVIDLHKQLISNLILINAGIFDTNALINKILLIKSKI